MEILIFSVILDKEFMNFTFWGFWLGISLSNIAWLFALSVTIWRKKK